MTIDNEGFERMHNVFAEALPLVLRSFLQVDPWKEKQSLRLGFGQFVDPDGDIVLMTGRQHFLDAVVDECPEVLETLRAEPFVLVNGFVEELIDWAIHRGRSGRDAKVFAAEMAETWVPVFGDTLAQLDPFIGNWMRDYHLGTADRPWGARPFVWTLFRWAMLSKAGHPPDNRLWDLPLDVGEAEPSSDADIEKASLLRDEVPIVLPTFRWNRRTETRAALEARVLAEIKRNLCEQVNHHGREASERGDVPAPVKPSGVEHFRWLARYQVCGESYSAIAKSAFRSRQAVMIAVQETAALIGLPLRPAGRRGRPAKPKAPRIVKVGSTTQKPVN